jgi:hypothetical protein
MIQSKQFWMTWLRMASLLVIAFGLALALLQGSSALNLLNAQIDPNFWSAPVEGVTLAFQRWIYGAWGATVAGWGVLVYFVVQHAWQQERWIWNGLAASLLLWYLLDTWISLKYGVTFNAVLNTVFLLVLGTPLLFLRKHFIHKTVPAPDAA